MRKQLLLIVPLLLASAAAAPPVSLYDEVAATVSTTYYDPRFNGVDWAEATARHRAEALQARDDAEMYRAIANLLGELRDAHTRLLTPEQARNRQQHRAVSPGLLLFDVEGQPTIVQVDPGSAAFRAGLRAGDRVIEIDGVDASRAVAAARAEVGPSSSPRAQSVRAYLRLLGGPAGSVLRLRTLSPGGEMRTAELARVASEVRPHFDARMLEPGIFYIRLDRFREPAGKQLQQALRSAGDVRGLILDLRSNGGGDGSEGLRVLQPLLAKPTLVARLRTRSGRPPSALMGLVKLPLEMMSGASGGQLYSGPIVVLVNDATASTAEVVAKAIADYRGATIVGTRTCGCALGVLKHRKLPGGAELAISEVALVTGAGERIEGEGITPNIVVPLLAADLAQGRDRALDAAKQSLGL